MRILPGRNHFGCNDLFLARMEQLLDAEMEAGSTAFIRLKKLPSGDYDGILAECIRTLLQYTSADYCLPSAFAKNSERAMLVSDRIVLVVKLADTSFTVEEIVWVEPGMSIPVAIAMELIKYWAYCVIDSAAYDAPGEMQGAIFTLRWTLFRGVRFPYYSGARVWPIEIPAESVECAAEEAGFKLADDFDYFHMTIKGDSVTISYSGEEPIVIWNN